MHTYVGPRIGTHGGRRVRRALRLSAVSAVPVVLWSAVSASDEEGRRRDEDGGGKVGGEQKRGEEKEAFPGAAVQLQ